MAKFLYTLILSAALALPGLSETVDVKTGATVITLDDTLVDGLVQLEVFVKKAQPARINPGKGTATLVASGGAIDLSNGKTEIVHSGGVRFIKDTFSATLLDPIIEFSEDGAVTPVAKVTAIVVVNGVSKGRMDVFNITGTVFENPPVEVPKNQKITATNLSLKLSTGARDELNAALGAPVFTTDTEIGKASINVKLAASSL